MTPELARLCHPVLAGVLDLAESHAPADPATLARLRAGFIALARAHPPDGPGGGGYLGLAYPVACLADELLTAHPTLGPAWTEQKLEAEVYGTNDRAWQFWAQAELALKRDPDDAELPLTCHGLGFRGEPAGGPDAAARFVAAARAKVLAALREPPPAPAALPPPASAPPLGGSALLRRAGVAAAVALAVGAAIAAVLLVRPLTG